MYRGTIDDFLETTAILFVADCFLLLIAGFTYLAGYKVLGITGLSISVCLAIITVFIRYIMELQKQTIMSCTLSASGNTIIGAIVGHIILGILLFIFRSSLFSFVVKLSNYSIVNKYHTLVALILSFIFVSGIALYIRKIIGSVVNRRPIKRTPF